MQRQADVLGAACVRPTVLETTGLGSALLAGLAVGLWDSTDAVVRAWQEDRTFTPSLDTEALNTQRAAWTAAVERA